MRLRIFGLLLAALLFPLTLMAQAPPAGFTSSVVSSGWNEAVGLTFNSTGSKMFVWERPGKVWSVAGGQRQLMLDISPEVGGWRDHGLLGFALDPNFDANGYIYLLYTVDRHHLINFGTTAYSANTNDYSSATIGRLTRYTATPAGAGYTVNQASRLVLLGATKTTGIPSTSYSHLVGALVFGSDGTLLVSTGDGAEPNPDFGSLAATYYTQALADGILQTKENVGSFRSQLVDCLNGKILRLDPATGAGVPSNPYYDPAAPNAPRSKVWALGCRNPFRMSLRPGTGSPDPAAGNPGVLYVGNVGANTWEGITVVDGPRVNLGWPLFEGLTPYSAFTSANTANRDAPNPLFNTGGCTQQFFYFRELLKAATPTGTASFQNACNAAQPIPAAIPTFVHTRPLIDWRHGSGPSRTGIFNGSTPTTINIGAAGSPVSGPQFGGNSVTGGIFYPYTDFPAPYGNSYFFADYASGWIRNLSVTSNNQPSAVANFVSSGCIPVGFAVSPGETGLFYVNFGPSEIRKISYITTNQPPVAVASYDRSYGPGPLSVQFTGSASSNPGGGILTYEWNFGDGSALSTDANPAHTFSPPTAAPTPYTVTLTVRNTQGLSNQTSLRISVNNTPPQVAITSPAAGTQYPLTGNTTFTLRATVSDQEHSAGQLSYQWQTILHHADHNHPDPVQTTPEGTLTALPVGCGAETYYYRVVLTVTDAAGLATTQETRLDPNCSTQVSFSLINANSELDIQPLTAGTTLNLATLPTRNLNIRFNADPAAAVGSVVLTLSGAQIRTQTESVAPYALFGDNGAGDYAAWTPAVGSYSLTATPYSGAGGSGTAGTSRSVSFSVTDATSPGSFTLTTATVGSGTVTRAPDQATYASGTSVLLTALPSAGFQFSGWSGAATGTTNPLTVVVAANTSLTATFTAPATGPQVVGFTLLNADTEQPVRELTAGDVLNLATLPTANLNIRANTSPATVGSVVLALSGTQARNQTESAAPYALFGDNGAGNYYPWTPAVGSYSLTATPYSGAGGSGTAGTSLTRAFSVINQAAARPGMALAQPPAAAVASRLRAYPNPTTNGLFRLEGLAEQTELQYTLCSALGVPLATGQLTGSAASALPLDLSRFMPTAGVYFLQLRSAHTNTCLRLLRQ